MQEAADSFAKLAKTGDPQPKHGERMGNARCKKEIAKESPMIDSSVVICTRDRAVSLARALASLAAMRRPSDFTWELVVVDNGSTDHTAEVVQGFAADLPVTVVREDRPGLSHARNRGIAVARGKYVIWTDDDVVVGNDWLRAYAAAFNRWPDAAIFGGKIIPVLEEPSPRWFSACIGEFSDLLAARDFGSEPKPLSEKLLPFGANFAVRTDEQRRFLYNPALGPQPGRPGVGDETSVLQAIVKAGGTGVYVPGAVVHHLIPARRQTLSYVMAYYRAQGEMVAVTELSWPARGAGVPISVAGRALPWLIFKIIAAAIVFGCLRPFAPAPVSMRYFKTLARGLGQAALLRETAGGSR